MSFCLMCLAIAFLPHVVVGLIIPQTQSARTAANNGGCNPAVGTWIRNADPEHNPPISYSLNEEAGAALRDFSPSPTQPFPEFMLWDWVPSGTCPLTTMTHASFCDVMAKHNFTHYTIVGDSMNFMMAQSFWKLLEKDGEPAASGDWTIGRTRGRFADGAEVSGFQGHVLCDQGDITFSYYRNDRIDNVKPGDVHQACGDIDFCFPWWDAYAERASTTLLMANTGLHHHNLNDYRKVVDDFFERISAIKDATVVFRESVPGHENCMSYTKPFESTHEFSLSPLYQWNLVPDFNAYVKERVQAKRLEGVNVMMLDVFEMSILRPDGHRSPKDCLHYYLPGLPDYWNHLLITEFLTTA